MSTHDAGIDNDVIFLHPVSKGGEHVLMCHHVWVYMTDLSTARVEKIPEQH